jgi:CRISPR-associated protein Csd2
LHVANGAILNDNVTEVTESLGIAVNRVTKAKKTEKSKTKAIDNEASDSGETVKSSLTADEAAAIRRGMCDKYVDVRLFGAVLGTGNVPAGYCHGPVQVGIAESVSPILTLELAITRCAATNAERAVNDTEMGRKHIVAYGLYRTEIHISGPRAAKTGMTYGDVQNLVHSLKMMWELDRSAARGMMSSRDIIVMRHHSPRCNAPSYVLRDLVSVTRSNGSNNDPATDYSDYTIKIGKMPEGVTLVES